MHPLTHGGKAGVVVRAFMRSAQKCSVVELDAPGRAGAVFLPGKKVFRYQLRYETSWGDIHQVHNAYSFLPSLSEQDLYLFNEGNEHRIYEKLGAHTRMMGDVPGVAFAVWAPAASRVSLVGNFNGWDPRYHPMRPLGGSGGVGALRARRARGRALQVRDLGPARAHAAEDRPLRHLFRGAAEQRGHRLRHEPLPVGRCRLDGEAPGAGRAGGPADVDLRAAPRLVAAERAEANRPFNYRELAPILADYVSEMGFTHIEVLPVSEFPFTGSWGYQVTGFFAPTHRWGTPEDFQFFVDHLHQRGIGLIVDWVPAHFPRDSFALAQFDGTHLYEHADPRLGAHMDWGTLIFNYGRHEVRCFLVASALSWLERYHIDGLRVDAVASMLYLDYSRKAGEWIPNQYGGRENIEAINFLRQVNDLVHLYYPGAVTIAEESTAFSMVSRPTKDGGLGFDYKWNMGMMHDTLAYFQKDPIHRKWSHDKLTFGMIYQYSENFISVYSHDEVVHLKASMLEKMAAGSVAEKAANLRTLYGYIWMYPGKKLLFMGSEFGQRGEWNHDASLDWHLLKEPEHEGLRLVVRDLNRLYTGDPVLSRTDFRPGSFRWVNCNDGDHSVISFLRLDEGQKSAYLVVSNFTPLTRSRYNVGVPHAGYWKEVLNTNSLYYGGTGFGNHGGRPASTQPADGYEHSLSLTLPGLSTLVFKWTAKE